MISLLGNGTRVALLVLSLSSRQRHNSHHRIKAKEMLLSMNILQQNQEVLSTREFEVLNLIARGCKNREIAPALVIEERTVRFHREHSR